MKHSRFKAVFGAGFLAGFFLLAPGLSILFLLQDEFAFLPAPAFCPASISLRTSDAELRFLSRAVEKAGCTLVFASSEGSSGGGPPLHSLSQKPGFVFVRDYHGFAPLRALAYIRRTGTHPRMLVLINHHYARAANKAAPDLGETWFAEGFAQSRLKEPGVLTGYMKPSAAARISPLREVLFRVNRSAMEMLRPQQSSEQPSQQQEPAPAPAAQNLAGIGRLDGTLFAQALAEVCGEPGIEVFLLPLNSKKERELGLDPAEQMRRIQDAAAVCKKVHQLPDLDQFFSDRIHWNEAGRRLLLERITEPSLL